MREFLFKKRTFCNLALIAGAVLASGCDMNRETYITQDKPVVTHQKAFFETPVSAVDKAFTEGLARDYARRGGDGLYMTITYDPHDRGFTAMEATNMAGYLADAMRGHGIRDVRADILPTKAHEKARHVLVSYTQFTARGMEDCKPMPGLESPNITNDREYKIGCSMQDYFARQVARPKDLISGEASPETSSGRRASQLLEGYATGTPNPALEGESASE